MARGRQSPVEIVEAEADLAYGINKGLHAGSLIDLLIQLGGPQMTIHRMQYYVRKTHPRLVLQESAGLVREVRTETLDFVHALTDVEVEIVIPQVPEVLPSDGVPTQTIVSSLNVLIGIARNQTLTPEARIKAAVAAIEGAVDLSEMESDTDLEELTLTARKKIGRPQRKRT